MKMRILGLTLVAFFLFNGAALKAGEHGKMVSAMAKEHTGSMKEYANKHFTGSSGSDDGGSTSGDGDTNSEIDDITGDLMDGLL